MPNYRETTGEATSWRRAHTVRLHNPRGLEGAGIEFFEEDVIALAGNFASFPAGSVGAAFDPTGTFALVNPATGEPTGAVMSHMDLYVVLHSLYIDLALKRDAAAAAPPPPEDIPPEDPPPDDPPPPPPADPPPEEAP